MSEEKFILPGELLDAVGVPAAIRSDVAYRILCSKLCAVVEAVLRDGRGPIRVDPGRVKEIASQDLRTIDPRRVALVLERPIGDPIEAWSFELATVEEIQIANRREALWRMGKSRN